MPAATKLKVFRTPIGFHDAYVAAPSQKAAMEAWGSDKGLFARGEAELVTDPALTAEPLASPGKVIKRLRGTAAEQIAAIEEERPAQRAKKGPTKRKAPPRPSRAALDRSEKALDAAKERQAQERDALAKREAALAAERRALEQAQAEVIARLRRERDHAAAEYEEAMRRWRG